MITKRSLQCQVTTLFKKNNELKKLVKETRAEMYAIKKQLTDPIVSVKTLAGRHFEFPGTVVEDYINVNEMTLRGKVNAIASHIGIDFNIEPAKVVKTPATIKVNKIKKGKK